jgi:hypothetical protein
VLVIASLAALSASLALLAAHLRWPVAADVLALTAVACGLGAFGSALATTLRRARRLPPRSARP